MHGPFAVPDEGHEARLAHGLLAAGRELDLAVLHSVLQGPRRFRDLRPLLEGRSDTNLTRCLARLGEDGLVRQGLDFPGREPVAHYAATGLGVAVILKAHEFRPVADVMAELRDAGVLGR